MAANDHLRQLAVQISVVGNESDISQIRSGLCSGRWEAALARKVETAPPPHDHASQRRRHQRHRRFVHVQAEQRLPARSRLRLEPISGLPKDARLRRNPRGTSGKTRGQKHPNAAPKGGSQGGASIEASSLFFLQGRAGCPLFRGRTCLLYTSQSPRDRG